MSTRSKILLSTLAIIIVLASIFWALRTKPSPLKEELNINQQERQKKADEEIVVVPPIDPETKFKLELQGIASSFAERYGSYSNQSNYENITDLKPFMTQVMQNWADNFIKQARAEQPDDKIYYGIFTRALNSQTESFSSNKVIVKVSCQKQESVGSSSNSKVYYQQAKVTFFKEDGSWRVAKIEWE